MSEWNDRIKSNTVWQILDQFGVAIDQASKWEGLDAQGVDSLERLRAVLTFCGKRLASADPYLMEPGPLNKICVAFTSAKAELESFTSDGNIARLVTANGFADSVLGSLVSVLSPITTEDLSTINESAASYRSTLQKYLDELSKTNKALKKASDENLSKLSELAAEITSERQKISTALSDYQSQFAIGQTNRVTEFATAQTERQVANTAIINQFEKSFAESQSERQQKYSAMLAENQAQFSAAQETRSQTDNLAQSDRSTAFSKLMIDYAQRLSEQNTQFTSQMEDSDRLAKEALAELRKDYEKLAQSILDEIDGKKMQVEKLVGVIGNLGVTSGYQLVANHARRMLYLWQFLTVIALAGLIGVALIIAKSHPSDSGDFLQVFATRMFLSVAVGVFAAYAASQADKASIVERRNRKLALELEAVGPYIAPLPVEMQNQFRADLGSRSFGVSDVDSRKSPESQASPANFIDLLKSKEIREFVEKFLKFTKEN